MKLSEQMREGIKKTKPMTGQLAHREPHCKTRACALGAVGIACGLKLQDLKMGAGGYKKIKALFPELHNDVECPQSHRTADFETVIWELNDLYKWSRERIADWVESIGF